MRDSVLQILDLFILFYRQKRASILNNRRSLASVFLFIYCLFSQENKIKIKVFFDVVIIYIEKVYNYSQVQVRQHSDEKIY